jgi:hypothetical protein
MPVPLYENSKTWRNLTRLVTKISAIFIRLISCVHRCDLASAQDKVDYGHAV